MRCAHCGVNVLQLKSVEGQDEWVHSEPGDPPYLHCKRAVATPDTVANWFGRILG